MNSRFEDAVGIGRDRAIGRVASEFLAPDQAEVVQAHDQEVIGSGVTRQFEQVVRAGDGGWHTFLTVKFPLPNDGDAPYALGGIATDITERKRLEEALKESEEHYRALVEVSPQMIWMTGADGAAVYFNQHTLDYCGLNMQQALGDGWLEAVHPDQRERVRDNWQRTIHTGEDYHAEFLARRAGDGAYHWHMARALPIRDDAGTIASWMGVAIDIDDRKRAEAERVRLAAIVESSDDSIIGETLDGVITSWNRGAERIFGYTADEVIGRPISILAPPDDPGEMASVLDRVRRGEKVDHYETRRRAKDGRVIDVSLTVSPIHDATGTIIGASKVDRDVTERKRLEEALKESEERHRLILESTVEGIIGVDLTGTITFVNPAATRLLGYSREELIGQRSHSLIHHSRADGSPYPVEECPMFASYTRGEAMRIEDEYLWRKDGHGISVEYGATPIFKDGSLLGSVISFTDITERKRAEVAQARLAAIVNSSDDAVIGETLDGIVTSWNCGAERIFGYAADEVVGRPVSTLAPPDDAGGIAADLERVRHGERIDHYETRRRTKDGRMIDVSLTISPVRDASGAIIGASRIARDVTGRKRAEAERLRLAAIVESSDDAIIGESLDGVITSWNRGAERVFGYSADEVIGRPISILSPSDSLWDIAAVVDHIRRGEPVHDFGTRRRTKDGRVIDVSLTISPILDASGTIVGASKIARDVTERKRAEVMLRRTSAKLARLATTDMLTGLRNSRHLHEALPVAFSMAARTDRPLSVIMLDVDHFKAYNDSFGHPAGDEVLRRIGSVLRRMIRAHDLAARYGGEEFVILLPATDSEAARVLAERVRTAIARIHLASRPVTASLGVATSQAGLSDGEALLARADDALYRAKRAGRDCVVHHDDPPGPGEAAPASPPVERSDSQAAPATRQDAADRPPAARLRKQGAELERLCDAMIKGWARAIDLRDHGTEGHSRRVTALMMKLAGSLGFSKHDLPHIRRGALLHDIGKIGIPDRILLKPGPLSEEEWREMRRHPSFACEMLAPIPALRRALEIPLAHHEHWDGTGYPRGLKGDQIPRAARAFAAVDIYDALTHARPYREAWPAERALAYIDGLAGNQLDPEMVAALHRTLDAPRPGAPAAKVTTAWDRAADAIATSARRRSLGRERREQDEPTTDDHRRDGPVTVDSRALASAGSRGAVPGILHNAS